MFRVGTRSKSLLREPEVGTQAGSWREIHIFNKDARSLYTQRLGGDNKTKKRNILL